MQVYVAQYHVAQNKKMSLSDFSVTIKTAANKACTRRWGFCANLKQFSTPQHFSSRTAFRRPPQRG